MKQNQIKFRVWNDKKKEYEKRRIHLSKEGEFLCAFGGYDIPMIQDFYIFEFGVRYVGGEKACLSDWWYEGDLVELSDGCIYLVAFMGYEFVLRFFKDPFNIDMPADEEDRHILTLWEADKTIKLFGNIHSDDLLRKALGKEK